MQNPAIHVRVSQEQNIFLADLATRMKVKKSDIVREALNTWITNLKRLETLSIIQAQ